MSPKARPMALLREADRAERARDLPAAVASLRQYAEQRPASPAVWNRIGRLLERMDRADEAVDVWRRAAELYEADGFLHKAVAVWRKVARRRAFDPEPLRRLAGLYESLGHVVEAAREYQQAADTCLRRGQRRAAAELLELKLALDDEPETRLALSRLAAQEGNVEQAAEHCARAGAEARKRGRPELAVEALERALELAPGSASLCRELAQVELEAGRAADAIVRLEAVGPERGAEVDLLLGEAYLAADRAADARAVFERNCEGAHEERGRRGMFQALLALGEVEEAGRGMVPLLEKLLEARRIDAAEALLGTLLSRAPDHVAGLVFQARLFHAQGRREELVQTYQRLAAAHRTRGEEDLARAVEELGVRAARPPETLAVTPSAPFAGRFESGASEADLDRAADVLREADALLASAGAELETSFGRPHWSRTEDLWQAFPAFRAAGLTWAELARADLFLTDPALAWGFFAARVERSRGRSPHRGLAILARLRSLAPGGGFAVTSLVESQFQRAGFDAGKVVECCGSLEWLQCARDCGRGVFRLELPLPEVDLDTLRARPPFPACDDCGGVARPNVLLLGDWAWSMERVSQQDERLQAWLRRLAESGSRLAVLECGETPRLPTLSLYVRRLVRDCDARIVRIGVDGEAVPEGGLGLRLSPVEALDALDTRLGAATGAGPASA